jgi:hypothetical protein
MCASFSPRVLFENGFFVYQMCVSSSLLLVKFAPLVFDYVNIFCFKGSQKLKRKKIDEEQPIAAPVSGLI